MHQGHVSSPACSWRCARGVAKVAACTCCYVNRLLWAACRDADLAGDPGLYLEGDGRAELGELLFEVLVAPQDVLGAVHDGRAI